MKKILSLILTALILLSGCNTAELQSTYITDVFSETIDDTSSNSISETVIEDTTNLSEGSSHPKEDDTTSTQSDAVIESETVEKTEKPTEAETQPPIIEDELVFTEDPYVGVDKNAFYANYKPAVSASDAQFRSQHFLMSGSISSQDQKPTLSDDRPMENGAYIRNSVGRYSDDGNTYYIVNSKGIIVNRVFRGGAYVTLEEVAAYIFAFGEIPANYVSKKSGNPATNPWGKYLRVNHSKFLGNTSKYPYEPELPEISGCGGNLQYFELDIGTTGTDCDPKYKPEIYNNGTKITRGAARIVYARYDANNDLIIDINEKYLFYTYNHYNDFCEYLNYEGGWGEVFGNITGGGKISSKTDYNPTPYVPTVKKDISNYTAA